MRKPGYETAGQYQGPASDKPQVVAETELAKQAEHQVENEPSSDSSEGKPKKKRNKKTVSDESDSV